jgi:hypothetical protein
VSSSLILKIIKIEKEKILTLFFLNKNAFLCLGHSGIISRNILKIFQRKFLREIFGSRLLNWLPFPLEETLAAILTVTNIGFDTILGITLTVKRILVYQEGICCTMSCRGHETFRGPCITMGLVR